MKTPAIGTRGAPSARSASPHRVDGGGEQGRPVARREPRGRDARRAPTPGGGRARAARGRRPAGLFDVAERAATDELGFSGPVDPVHEHHHAEAVTRELSAPVSADALVDLVESTVAGVARVKGIVDVRVGASCRTHVVHVVTGTAHVEPFPSGAAVRALVAVGHCVDAVEVRRRFDTVATERPSTPAGGQRPGRLLRLDR